MAIILGIDKSQLGWKLKLTFLIIGLAFAAMCIALCAMSVYYHRRRKYYERMLQRSLHAQESQSSTESGRTSSPCPQIPLETIKSKRQSMRVSWWIHSTSDEAIPSYPDAISEDEDQETSKIMTQTSQSSSN